MIRLDQHSVQRSFPKRLDVVFLFNQRWERSVIASLMFSENLVKSLHDHRNYTRRSPPGSP